MLSEIAQEARNRIAFQPGLYKATEPGSSLKGLKVCTCVGLALEDALRANMLSQDLLYAPFLEANDIPSPGTGFENQAIYDWNDAPGRTLEEAVAALDALVEYLRTQEAATN